MAELYYFVKLPFSRDHGPKGDRKAEPVFRKSLYLLTPYPPWRNQASRKEPPAQSCVSLSRLFRKGGD